MNDLRIHHVTFVGDSMSVSFSDERSVAVPLSFFPRLLAASSAEREQWQLIGRGLGIHWELLDEDLSVENILSAYSRNKTSEYAHASLA
ncbi:MAG: DUF2442 domain-containing protein [Prosthecobacter sp.]|nr:DUF2442 domain-containing protein [Prosthecobacter sp.]